LRDLAWYKRTFRKARGGPAADTGPVLTVSLAQDLRDAGLRWTPAAGDRFVLPNRGMDDEVFVLSEMTVDVHHFPTGTVIGFNGVTEWALDSVEQRDALWIPAEEQLRDRLGGLFTRLEVLRSGSTAEPEFVVTVTLPDGPRTFRAGEAAEAYGRALLAVLRSVGRSDAEEPDAEGHVAATGG
jgi:hypothetical protein